MSDNGEMDGSEYDEAGSDNISDSSSDDRDEDAVLDGEVLQDRLAEMQQELFSTREQLNQAKTELALEQSKRPTLYDDRYFEKQLNALRGKITRWCCSYFQCAGPFWTMPAEKRFSMLSDEWAAYMEDSNRRPWLIQAQVWYILQQRLFDPQSDKLPSWLFTGTEKEIAIDKMFLGGLAGLNPQYDVPY